MQGDNVNETEKRLASLKAWAAQLDEKFLNSEAKEALYGQAKNWIADMEKYIETHGKMDGAEMMMDLVAQQLKYADTIFSKYGPNMRLTGN
jgi:hypothetical protein